MLCTGRANESIEKEPRTICATSVAHKFVSRITSWSGGADYWSAEFEHDAVYVFEQKKNSPKPLGGATNGASAARPATYERHPITNGAND